MSKTSTPSDAHPVDESATAQLPSLRLMEGPVCIQCDGRLLDGTFVAAQQPWGVVLFAECGGRSRLSPHDRLTLDTFALAGLDTLEMDMLTESEREADVETAEFRFDIHRLASRVACVTDWLLAQPIVGGLPIGYFSAGAGAAATLLAASMRPESVHAIVCASARPNLVGPALERMHVPTLLVVGERDGLLVEANQAMLNVLPGEKALVSIAGATRGFEEHGAREQLEHCAVEWFANHLVSEHGVQGGPIHCGTAERARYLPPSMRER